MVLISLVCSNLTTKISKIFETCKSFWPASEDFVNFATAFVNSATAFVNSATPRGAGPRSPAEGRLPGGQILADLPKTKPPSSSL